MASQTQSHDKAEKSLQNITFFNIEDYVITTALLFANGLKL